MDIGAFVVLCFAVSFALVFARFIVAVACICIGLAWTLLCLAVVVPAVLIYAGLKKVVRYVRK